MTFPPTPEPPLLYRRKYKPGETVSMPDLRAALVEAAKLLELDERAILLFQRIEQEIKSRETHESILARARQVAQGSHAIKGEAHDH